MGQYAASMPPRRRWEELSKATVPFDFAQGREPVERQMMPCWRIRAQKKVAFLRVLEYKVNPN